MASLVRMSPDCLRKAVPLHTLSSSGDLCYRYGKLPSELTLLRKAVGKPATSRRLVCNMAAVADRGTPTAPAGKQDQISKSKTKGKTVVVTGGSQGCGKEIALLFASKGYNVVVVAREPTRLEEVADKVASIRGNKAASLAVPTDIASREAVQSMASAVRDHFESVDILINNAGICATGPFMDTPLEVWDSQMNVNLMGPVNVTHALLPDVIRARGAVLFVNSFGARVALKNMAAYTASKHALAGFADTLAMEMEGKGVHVAQVQPGIIESDFLERAVWHGDDAEAVRAQTEQVMKTSIAVKPIDVANAVWNVFQSRKKEVSVGSTTQFVMFMNRLGINMTALR